MEGGAYGYAWYSRPKPYDYRYTPPNRPDRVRQPIEEEEALLLTAL